MLHDLRSLKSAAGQLLSVPLRLKISIPAKCDDVSQLDHSILAAGLPMTGELNRYALPLSRAYSGTRLFSPLGNRTLLVMKHRRDTTPRVSNPYGRATRRPKIGKNEKCEANPPSD